MGARIFASPDLGEAREGGGGMRMRRGFGSRSGRGRESTRPSGIVCRVRLAMRGGKRGEKLGRENREQGGKNAPGGEAASEVEGEHKAVRASGESAEGLRQSDRGGLAGA